MSAAAPQLYSAAPAGRIGIVAGAGSLPAAIADAAKAAGGDPFILGFSGNAEPSIERFPHAYVNIGQTGAMFRILRREGCKRLVFIGGVRRPNLFRIRIDAGFVWHLPQLLSFLKGGDDSALRGVGRFFEAQGFEVVGAHEIAPQLLAPEGSFSRHLPRVQDLEDIKLGFKVARGLGAFDIGQAAVVAHGYVLAVEAAEGTDNMLRRCGELNGFGYAARKGVLVKRPKLGQDRRFDLPGIGPQTVELAAQAGLAGIAVEAGQVLLAEVDELVAKAREHGLFLYGVPAETEGR
jgi:UDP-2,3-diacylglucosamine hydrolase